MIRVDLLSLFTRCPCIFPAHTSMLSITMRLIWWKILVKFHRANRTVNSYWKVHSNARAEREPAISLSRVTHSTLSRLIVTMQCRALAFRRGVFSKRPLPATLLHVEILNLAQLSFSRFVLTALNVCNLGAWRDLNWRIMQLPLVSVIRFKNFHSIFHFTVRLYFRLNQYCTYHLTNGSFLLCYF